MKHFGFSIIFSLACLALSAYWGLSHGPEAGVEFMFRCLFLTVVLAVLEISLSFDNAVINASVLKHWDEFWRKLFLTVGILIAVFGMRLVFPLLIVAVTAEMGMIEVAKLALNDPVEYSKRLMAHHAEIAAFGGMFLLMVFINFFFDEQKDVHWINWLERKATWLSKVGGFTLFVALIALLVMGAFVEESERLVVVMAGIWGLLVYIGVQVVTHLLGGDDLEVEADPTESQANAKVVSGVMKGGIGGFLYLEVLDASFSFDGVIGAFAITNDVVIIMLGLAIGAIFVRSMTVYLVDQGTLAEYRFLEHGAHYAIGALAIIMMLSGTGLHVNEMITGGVGIAFILASLFSSKRYNAKQRQS